MQINDILKLKFPNANFLKDIILKDDGQGIYIKEWNLKDPQPTQKDLDQWAIDLQDKYTFIQNSFLNAPIISQLNDIDAKSIRALRTKDVARLDSLEAKAAALRTQLRPTQ